MEHVDSSPPLRRRGSQQTVVPRATQSSHSLDHKPNQIPERNLPARRSTEVDSHHSKLVRSVSLKALQMAFQEMRTETGSNRPISEIEFRNHIMKSSPALLCYAHDMFHTIVHMGQKGGVSGDSLDFRQLMVALFPESSESDLTDMVGRSSAQPVKKELEKDSKFDERAAAKEVFQIWNKRKTGKLSFDEFKAGLATLETIHLTPEEIADALEEVYEDADNPGVLRIEEIDLEEFTHWYMHDGKYANV